MSHTLPVAPPPPPPPASVLKCANNHENITCNTQKPLLEECLWSVDQPELQKACFLARICMHRKPRTCQFYNIASILQVGPTCGLTALSMLLGGVPTPEYLLNKAKECHFSYNGEMFSARQLYQMVCDYLPIIYNNNNNEERSYDQRHEKELQQRQLTPAADNKLCECQMHEGQLNCAKVKEALQTGACLFVPYDPDYNHSPCLKMGHKAHWALIIGYLINENDEFFVIARHGKAKNLAVWSLQSLSDSNANLLEFAQPKGYPDCDFLLPPGGISGDLGLRERAIIVKDLPLEVTTIS